MNRILVVCVGNICRSPMAEALIKERALTHGHSIDVSSAGLNALVGSPVDPVACDLLAQQQIDILAHRARQLTADYVFDADLILTMNNQQTQQIISQYSGTQGRVYRIGQMGGFDIPDPYKRPRVIFEHTLALISQAIDEWQRILWNK